MTFLLMDTSGAMCVLALAEEQTGFVRAVRIFEGKRTLSRRLMDQMDTLLREEGVSFESLTAFAVGLGPGSFTGVRVGVTTMRTLAQVTGKSLVGIGTLDAYAAPWSVGAHFPIVAVLPSRRDEVYAAVYQNGKLVEPPFALAPSALTTRLDAMPNALVCGDLSLLPQWMGAGLAQGWTPPEGLARLASQRFRAGETDDPLGLLPQYVVPPSISTPKETLMPLPPSGVEKA